MPPKKCVPGAAEQWQNGRKSVRRRRRRRPYSRTHVFKRRPHKMPFGQLGEFSSSSFPMWIFKEVVRLMLLEIHWKLSFLINNVVNDGNFAQCRTGYRHAVCFHILGRPWLLSVLHSLPNSGRRSCPPPCFTPPKVVKLIIFYPKPCLGP